jgi:DNA-binding XRE family transcriptional regulator
MTLIRIVSAPHLLVHAQLALGVSQEELGNRVGVSRRTMTRWGTGKTSPDFSQWAQIARLTYAVNRVLAAQIATEMGESLVSLGIEAPPPPPAPAPAPSAAPARPPIPVGDLVDSIVCAAAEAASTTPQAMRPAILAALDRMLSVQLGVDEVRAALKPAPRKRA